MKTILFVGGIAILCYLLSLFLPWWVLFPVCFTFLYFKKSSNINAFLTAFLGVFLLWLIHGFVLYSQGGQILTEKMAEMFFINNQILFLIITAIVGGLCGGFAGLSGKLFKDFFRQDTNYKRLSV